MAHACQASTFPTVLLARLSSRQPSTIQAHCRSPGFHWAKSVEILLIAVSSNPSQDHAPSKTHLRKFFIDQVSLQWVLGRGVTAHGDMPFTHRRKHQCLGGVAAAAKCYRE